jgi:predicted  nucleic acid-binding Zn-ribbon protein
MSNESVDALNEEIERLRDQVGDLEDEVSDLEIEVSDLEIEVSDLEEELADYRRENAALEKLVGSGDVTKFQVIEQLVSFWQLRGETPSIQALQSALQGEPFEKCLAESTR